MALKGTLKDFGIADILQLIGQQQKTGVLHLRSKDQEVQIGFKDGSIVSAESTTRKKKDLIGNMLVRAELITEQQLELALETQKRTLKRLGDVLVAERVHHRRALQADDAAAGHRDALQALHLEERAPTSSSRRTSSTDARGHHAAARRVGADGRLPDGGRVAASSGRRSSPPRLTFEQLKELPAAPAGAGRRRSTTPSPRRRRREQGRLQVHRQTERRVYELIAPGRDVRKLIDLSLPGRVRDLQGALQPGQPRTTSRAVEPAGGERPCRDGRLGQRRPGGAGQGGRQRGGARRLVLAALGSRARASGRTPGLATTPASSFADPAAQRFVARAQQAPHRGGPGGLPAGEGRAARALEALVEAGLSGARTCATPGGTTYYYRRGRTGEFILLPPLR